MRGHFIGGTPLPMRRLTLLAMLTIASFSSQEIVLGQTEKVLQREGMHGQKVQTPYVSYDEFQSATVNSTSGKVSIGEILNVPSLEKVTQVLGDPKSVKRNEDPNDGSFTVWLYYEGRTTLKYHGFEDGTLGLSKIELQSPGWSLVVGGTRLYPGMGIRELSPAVRGSISEVSSSKEAEVDGIGVVGIAEPEAAKSGSVELLQGGRADIAVHVDKGTGTVRYIRFGRIPQ